MCRLELIEVHKSSQAPVKTAVMAPSAGKNQALHNSLQAPMSRGGLSEVNLLRYCS